MKSAMTALYGFYKYFHIMNSKRQKNKIIYLLGAVVLRRCLMNPMLTSYRSRNGYVNKPLHP